MVFPSVELVAVNGGFQFFQKLFDNRNALSGPDFHLNLLDDLKEFLFFLSLRDRGVEQPLNLLHTRTETRLESLHGQSSHADRDVVVEMEFHRCLR